ncbi:MAG TPA: glycosyltransferase family 39 protein [Acidobacteriota bacterium]|nr:glycosyltransferase family 39 protein [Acidobacteriota bacterium]
MSVRTVQAPLVILLVCLAFAFRVYRLDAPGLAEDEVHKILAVESYREGEFVVNAEHPMLMKLVLTATFLVADSWNQSFAARLDWPAISPEFAVRFPNVVVGSLTTIPIFLLARILLGPVIALISAAFWAIGINAIAFNRIAKEDSLLVFFVLLAFFFYQKAKTVAPRNESLESRWYALSGATFGFALASKYFPHYLGLIFLCYYVAKPFNLDRNTHTQRMRVAFFSAFLAVFLLCNPVILHPDTWRYLATYVSGNMMTHHGYVLMGTLYRNEAPLANQGTPVYFYLLYLLVKAPVPLLVLCLLGIVRAVKRCRTDLGHFFVLFMFAAWIIPFSLAGGKWLRYTLSLLPWVYMLAAIGLVMLADVTIRIWKRTECGPWLGRIVTAAIAGACFYGMTITSLKSAPYYSLFVNTIGGGKSKAGSYFPHDEFYDLGLREAVAHVAQSGPHSSAIYSDADDLVRYYAKRFGRTDLRQASLCREEPRESATSYVLVQDGRRYFENAERIQRIERTFLPEKEVRIGESTAVRIYRIPGRLQAGAVPPSKRQEGPVLPAPKRILPFGERFPGGSLGLDQMETE